MIKKSVHDYISKHIKKTQIDQSFLKEFTITINIAKTHCGKFENQ